MRDLKILTTDDNLSFNDVSIDLNNYLKDIVSVADASITIFYVGLHKQFSKIYLELDSFYDGSGSFLFQANTSAGLSALLVTDESKDLTRSGFVEWSKGDFWDLTTINGDEKYWLKITCNNVGAYSLKGLNIVFSNDDDLMKETSLISDRFKRTGEKSFINYHVASRDEMIQRFKNSGKVLKDSQNNIFEISQWDFNRPEQLREASKYLTLSKIFFDVSSEIDDKYYQKYTDYMSQFQKAFDLYLLSIDFNDDGRENENEKRNIRAVKLSYL